MLSATDAFPDGTLAQLRSQPMGDSNFSDIEDEGSSDDSAFHFSAPAALADDPAVVPATTAATAAGRPSAFLLNTYRRRCHLRMAEAGAPALAHNEPITTVPDGRAPSDASRSHRGSGLTSAASAHHPQVTEATTPTLAPSEPTTAVSDGRPLSTAGTSHQGADPAPTADPRRGTRAGGSPTSHFSVMSPPAADDATMPTASAVATLADSSSPDVAVDTADGATATAAFALSVAAPPAADADMAADMSTDIAVDGPDVVIGDATDGTIMVHQSAAHGDASSGIDTSAAADPGIVSGGVPDRALGAGTSADAHGLATNKRRRRGSHAATRATPRHCQRMAEFGTARGNTLESDPGPVGGRRTSGGGFG